jgi:demethylmenaquinone methyltransferase/2-methoxy-6-polyprenyl-1,4-benzoquinol methylase
LGQTKAWRTATTAIIAPKSGMQILDLAAGPGSSSEPLYKAGATVFATDFSEGMLAQGRKVRPYLNFSKADALNLPFEANRFDVVTISYGLRNTVEYDKALVEALRVTKTGGRIVIAEFSHPTNRIFRIIYFNYLMSLLPAIAKTISSNADAYVYLAESIRAWPDQAALAKSLEKAGWSHVGWKNLTFGVVAVHSGIKG